MHILVLATAIPSLNHSAVGASGRVLGVLLQGFVEYGHKCTLAMVYQPSFVGPVNVKEIEQTLQNVGVNFLGDYSDCLDQNGSMNPLLRKIEVLRKTVFPRMADDAPCFNEPENVLTSLLKAKPDVALLFWDTWFEHLLPFVNNIHIPFVSYWAKPRYAASLALLQDSNANGFVARIRKEIIFRFFNHNMNRHYVRARRLTAVSNICALDAKEYKNKGISCEYISNTWPDAFGNDWHDKRMKEKSKRDKFGILGNLGKFAATGNFFGLRYLGEKVMPHLNEKLNDVEWELNLCGPGKLPENLNFLLKFKNMNFRGFVSDPDAEILANPVFLILNNAGKHTGGYTRIVYAFSSGACLIAHRKLMESMPEVKHGVNALLGETGEEIADLVVQAVTDRNLRERLGVGARKTFEQEYHPKVVAKKLIEMASGTVTSR